ncbi:MAG: hypothetical protein COZ75_00815 [Flavobacteriaceae bacterium CG_4_8_14_3_um_filter_34_10]|nr:hypothetical protein [Flavobacteriia bacterium]PIQ18367.1 MAG: hypothetical protein COW66_06805 [Flavobacteriaceae bacterium CG18_big_fil_WC_8_21_14_2_50_34_36]PIV49160.1 MAG: hypothetical protein COS19_10060 [Flavobacteriaceae bacterium CG02_land_8_20_14_3_00_34_13]PIX10587.1 MAG: hypothetical protein COZ75_00815 [Flavobacteriaceae bacterium CG_4_8_14_3_um_filter_34_10]PIZ08650.1 MAG: hypothetical protein COY56_02795 [Flavobacteriaceae bacterium CG_4_10_14_0_8_um_filter_34_31]PJC07683.1 MA
MQNHLQHLQLYPIDVIIAKKRTGLGRILNHYIVYLGNGIFIGNLKGCVRQLSQAELTELLYDYEPVKIRRFEGNPIQVHQAINRARLKLGQPYSFLGFNCEHFANWVQYGRETSSQVSTAFLIIAGLVTVKLMDADGGR